MAQHPLTLSRALPAPQPAVAPEFVLTEREFDRICTLLYRHSRIALIKGKEGLVRARLAKHMRRLKLATFTEYFDHVEREPTGRELSELIDTLTTNRTNFFREIAHFDYLREHVLPTLLDTRRPLRLWSAGCSTGDEAYTLAMLIADMAPDFEQRDIRILGTDLSSRVLTQAKAGEYPLAALEDIPLHMRPRFTTLGSTQKGEFFRIRDTIRTMVSFARLNLMAVWPMRQQFDVIFCRNVMIYFDRETQQQLVHRLWDQLAPGGHFFVGHSESLTPLRHKFRGLRPAVYVK
jgi:chemotaxis protein methyltransferase CheR